MRWKSAIAAPVAALGPPQEARDPRTYCFTRYPRTYCFTRWSMVLTPVVYSSNQLITWMRGNSRALREGLYAQLARIGKALASPHRIEILDLLAQSERTVESLCAEIGLSAANASQHLQVLRQAGLVASRKDGLYVHYRLADPSVFELTRTVRRVAEQRLAELERHVREHFADRIDPEGVDMQTLLARLRTGEVLVVDTRPLREFEAGHIEGAISVPIDELERRIAQLPKRKEIVAYCRGPYCVYADRAVELLRASGRRARRMKDGFPEWKAAGLPIALGTRKDSRNV